MQAPQKTRGQPTTFNAKQNAALHAALRELQEKRRRSQRELGELLGIGQQSAGYLERHPSAGFSHRTATNLVRAIGYASVDTFFRAKGVATPSEPPHAKSA